MAAELDIRQDDVGITFEVKAKASPWALPLQLLGTACFIYLLVRNLNKGWVGALLTILVVGLIVARGISATAKGTAVILRVDRSSFVSTGYAPGGYEPHSVPRLSIKHLLFHTGSGDEDSSQPSGLHVTLSDSTGSNSICVLPDVDESQVYRCIVAIMQRYPDTTDSAAPSKACPSPLIRLGLTESQ